MAAHAPPPQHSDPGATPAEPLLASALLSSGALASLFNTAPDPPLPLPTSDEEGLRTGISSLDALFHAAIQRGRVVALSSATPQRDDVAKLLLVHCLLKGGEAVVVDARGEFDVLGLYALVLRRLEGGRNGGNGRSEGQQRVQDEAKRVLDRVRIMRVFDFEGVSEAVGELAAGLRGGDVSRQDGEALVSPQQVVGEERHAAPPKRTEVADSEDEDEGVEASDEEMLFDAVAPAPHSPKPILALASAQPTPQQNTSHDAPHRDHKLILIDNLAHVLTALLKKDSVQGTALATSLLTSLTSLTQTHALYTLLLNPCTAPRAPSPTRPAQHQSAAAQSLPQAVVQQGYARQPPPPPSVFSSNAAVPALGALYARFAHLHVLLSRLPRRRVDARVYYADGQGERAKRRGVEMVGVAEVVCDRWGGGCGAWGTYREG